ncbi:MAG TPA: NAD(+) diphosphatase [Paracoccaceae bacterium]|nr:NAD(+) diphosphatase [Paracoccaceae bacterium]
MTLEPEITFGGSRLDRSAQLRGDENSLAALRVSAGARSLALWHGKPLFQQASSTGLAWLPLEAPVLAEATEEPVFLGRAAGEPRFAHDVSAWKDPAADEAALRQFFDRSANRHPSLPPDYAFLELRAIMAELTPEDAGDAALAKALLGWHETHRFCARCGQPSRPAEAGWQRLCPACGAQHFPRTDPVAIVLALHGDRVLLGRSPIWPEGMYSLLAGFVEPGETLEAAARREVFEEAGIRLGAVRVVANQPWPFPASLMVGCAAEALDRAITLDPKELADAAWVSRQEVMESLAGLPSRFRPARKGSIARTLLAAWAAGRIGF